MAEREEIHHCPDVMAGVIDYDCWFTEPGDLGDGVDIVSWLKAEMLDGMNHAFAHEALGPAIFGYEEDGTPHFTVYKLNGAWLVKAKPEYRPPNLKGIFE